VPGWICCGASSAARRHSRLADPDVLVVGAGLSGLTAARVLADAGRTVRLLDGRDGPGGRLATRRIGDATFDHGAQFFTVRSPAFAALIRSWRDRGAPIGVWSHGFAQVSDIRAGRDGVTSTAGDGHPRHRVGGGMDALARVLARGLDVQTDTPVTAIRVRRGRWHVAVRGAGGTAVHRAGLLVCTPPVPQTLALFARGDTALPAPTVAVLERVAYEPCLALLVVLDDDPALPPPGGLQFASGPVRWLADNARKDVSTRPAVTLHAAGAWSAAWYDADDAVVATTLGGWLRPWLGAAGAVTSQVARWRYAQPRDLVEHATLTAEVDGAQVAFAGDAFAQARVEGAACSGLAAAEALLDR